MFPAPIERSSAPLRVGYRTALGLALFVWLLPLAAIMLTSVRSLADINAGNYWGMPTEWHLRVVLEQGELRRPAPVVSLRQVAERTD